MNIYQNLTSLSFVIQAFLYIDSFITAYQYRLLRIQ